MDANSQELNNAQDKKILKNIVMVAFSNILTILAGVLSGFLIPKIMGIDDYGYYKIFTLYISYVGLFHFGFIDGIYLYYAGKKYDDIDKNKFKFFTRFLIFFQTIIFIIITGISMFFVKTQYGFIFVFVGITLIINNLTSYYQFVSQITFRFKELALRNTYRSILTCLSVSILFLIYKYTDVGLIKYQIYVYIYTLINFLLLIWYIYTYRDITFGREKYNSKFAKREIVFFLFKLGFPLLLSNLVGTLILNIDRQFVSILFDTSTYAVYAFAYNMLSLVTTAVAAVSTVLYPSLKSKNEEYLKKSYSKLNGIMLIIVSFCLIGYFPLKIIVNWFLPQYVESLDIFRVIFPGLLFNTTITIVMANFYKSLDLVRLYFLKSVFVLILSALMNLLVYFIFKSPIAISIASVLVMFFWYIMTEFTLIRRWKFNFMYNLIYAILIVVVFYLITFFVNNVYLGCMIYLCSFCLITFIFERDNLTDALRRKIL